MLFIDELGIENASVRSWGNELAPMNDLLSYRYDNRLFTLATTNRDQEGMEEFYGPRLADRFNEMFDRLAYVTPSYRSGR